MPARTATAHWQGGLRDGNGTMALGSGAYEGAYSFTSRFEDGAGTNPEELLGAAHAACFSMALSAGLEGAGSPPDTVETTATVHLVPADGGGFRISRIDLATTAAVPGIDPSAFQEQAEAAKANCPVSKALAGVDIHLQASLKT
ncbi:MAG TPA: OsmC family protein [Acidimicrobiales bacterium]|jgi:osmotically inducible protein OsmC|nr:OsmC family protein [Acidimicrobiales bacterium]